MPATPPANDPWIQRPRPRPGALLRLFCLPHAGGGASAFRGWAEAMPAEVEVCPVKLPGREARLGEPAIPRMEPLVDELVGVTERWSDLPFAIFGHSNGALIGFELARRLRREGRPGPVHLFASGRRAPDVPASRAPVAHLPDEPFVAELRELGGTPPEVLDHPEILPLLLPLLRADMALAETYEYREEPPLECPITAYSGLADVKVSRADAEAWGRHTRAGFTLRMFAGDHFFILAEPTLVVQTLAADVEGIFRRAMGM